MKPFFSVLMPVHNAERTLEAALDSVLASEYKNWELIIVDDNSHDRSPHIALKVAAGETRIKVLFHEGGPNLVSALNAGLRECQAPWVARFDADDLMSPRRLGAQKELIDKRPEVKLIGGQVEFFPAEEMGGGLNHYAEWLNALQSSEELAADIFVEAPIAHPVASFCRETVKALGNYRSGPFPEDYDLYLRLWEKDFAFASLPEVLLKWRLGPGRLSFSDSRYSDEAFRQLKLEYLLKHRLKDHKEFALLGAGEEGKKWATLLTEAGLSLKYWIEVDPGKIGQKILAAPVLSYEEMADNRGEMPHILCTVGINSARKMIRNHLKAQNFTEGDDFTCLA